MYCKHSVKFFKKILKKLDLSIDDLVNYALQVHEDKGKSLNS